MSELKPESIITFLGFKPEEIKSEEDFKTNFEKEFGRKSQLMQDKDFTSKIFGQRVGSIENRFLSNVKKMGIDIPKEELKDKPVEEIMEIALLKIADTNKRAMDELEKQSKGTTDEQVKQWKDKYKSVEDKLKETEGLLSKTATDFEGYKKDTANKFKETTLNRYKNEALGKVKFKQNATEVEKKGFMTILADKYDFDLDENEQFFVKDKKSGQRIPSSKVTGQFKTAEEILNEELIANKLAEINPNGGQRVVYSTQSNPNGNSAPVTNPLKFNKRFQEAGGQVQKIGI